MNAPPPISSSASRPQQRRRLAAAIYLHPDVPDRIEQHPNLRRRLGITLRQMAAVGRTAIVKGCHGRNEGWLRSPMGGNSGNQFYLWWRSGQLDGQRQLFLRDVRHHDDWSDIDEGEADDYIELGRDELLDPEWVDEPWTEEQSAFANARGDVTTLIGTPGSGKTTALWERVVRNASGKTLYVSWSRDLTAQAKQYFDAFLPDGAEVECTHFAGLLSQITGQRVPSGLIRANIKRFRELAGVVPPAFRKGWKKHYSSVFSELRAHYYGLSPLANAPERPPAAPQCMDADSFCDLRESQIGESGWSANDLLELAQALESAGHAEQCFGDLVAATDALSRLREGSVPAAYQGLSMVVVDECQDLTMLELSVLTSLCKAIGAQAGKVPQLLVSGDEGQTVRPTGFDWGRLSTLLHRELGTPDEHRLTNSLRCPERIVEVLDQASLLYQGISKSKRPAKQTRNPESEATNANVLLVASHNADELIGMLRKAAEMDRCAIVTPDREPPSWLPGDLKKLVLIPEVVKGLEYQTVLLLDPCKSLGQLDPQQQTEDVPEARMRIDRLRVALSRATETLIAVVKPSGFNRKTGRPLPGDHYWRTRDLFVGSTFMWPNEALEMIDSADSSAEERLSAKLALASSSKDEDYGLAARSAHQAFLMLGDPGLPNGVHDPGLRQEAAETFLETFLASLIVLSVECDFESGEMGGHVDQALSELGVTNRTTIIRCLKRISELNKTRSPGDPLDMAVIELVQAVYTSQGQKGWFTRATTEPVSDDVSFLDIFEDMAESNPAAARALASPELPGWLELLGWEPEFEPDLPKIIHEICFDTLLKADDYEGAEQVVKSLMGDQPSLMGLVAERRGHYAQAARYYKKAGSRAGEIRCRRASGNIEKALELMPDKAPGRAALEWVLELERLSKPKAKIRDLTPAEARRITDAIKILEAVAKRSTPAGC